MTLESEHTEKTMTTVNNIMYFLTNPLRSLSKRINPLFNIPHQ